MNLDKPHLDLLRAPPFPARSNLLSVKKRRALWHKCWRCKLTARRLPDEHIGRRD